jgi:predicted Zn-dependent protease
LEEAVENHNKRNFSAADKMYTTILKQVPDHPDAMHNLGILAVEVGEKSHALRNLRKVVEKYGQFKQFHISLIDALVEFNELEEAKVAIELAEKKDFGGAEIDKLKERLSLK